MALMTEIDRAILRTIIYFDLFDFPLTASEIQENLIIKNQTTLPAILNSLNNLKTLISCDEGFYFLTDRRQQDSSKGSSSFASATDDKRPLVKNSDENLTLVQKRKERYLIAEEKYKIAL